MNPEVNLDSPESLSDPTGYFVDARSRGDIQWSAHHNAWMVLSHAAVEEALRDTARLSSDKSATFARAARGRSQQFQHAVNMLDGWMNFRDPPVHDRLREPVKSAFTPRAIRALEAEVQDIVDSVLAAFAPESAELTHDFARPIPALVIGALLGVPPEDRSRFHEWSYSLSQLVFAVNPGAAPEGSVGAAAAEFIAFFRELVERDRREPAGGILSSIIAAGSEMSEIELIGACTLLLFGGHETTTTLLVNALGILLSDPEKLEWLREHLDAMPTAIEEFMRVQGPARVLSRKVSQDHARDQYEFRVGQNVFLCVASANHDPGVFSNPAEIDLLRDPNPHLGFGWGPHYCLGASLARLEAGIALRTLIQRFPKMHPVGEVAPPRASALGFGRRPLPVWLR